MSSSDSNRPDVILHQMAFSQVNLILLIFVYPYYFFLSLSNSFLVAFTTPLKRLSPFLKSPLASAAEASLPAAFLYFASRAFDISSILISCLGPCFQD